MSTTSTHDRSSLNNNSIVTDNSETLLIAKLRRLKMQEKLLFNSVNIKVDLYNTDIHPTGFIRSNMLETEVKKSYQEIKRLFEDVKYNTSFQGVHDIDVEQVKKDVLLLETKMLNTKRILNTEMNTLKEKEEELLKEINDQKKLKAKPRKHTPTNIKSFNDIVPSPVKNIINTPCKYKEVQSLHDFLKDNGGKNGGWLEYNHNLFVQSRNKYMQEIPNDNEAYEYVLEILIDDLMVKIIGTTREKIRDHENWYLQYLKLKNAQQEVLQKWKESRKNIRSAQHYKIKEDTNQKIGSKKINKSIKREVENTSPNEFGIFRCSSGSSERSGKTVKDVRKIRDNYNFKTNSLGSKSTFMEPTKGWTRKLLKPKVNEPTQSMSLENISKFGIPKWRQQLLDE